MKAQAPKPVSKQSLTARSAETAKVTTYKDCNGIEVSLSSYIINNYLAPVRILQRKNAIA